MEKTGVGRTKSVMTGAGRLKDRGDMPAGGMAVFLLLLFLAFCLSFAAPAAAGDDIRSRAAVVMDATTGRVLYAKNPDLKLLPASTTKLMTALVVLERAKLTDVTTVSRHAASQPPTKAHLKPGDKVTIETLLYAALMKSANDAAVVLAEAVAGSEEEFVRLMNDKAVAIGADDTRFVNANGLPAPGQHITAYDLAKIMRQAIKYPTIREIIGTRITEISTETGKQMFIRNTNKLLWSDDELLGGKTGYTRDARHCFVCAGERDKDTIIVALLGAPNRNLLWKESEELMGFGAKVLARAEEPVIYLTRSDADSARVRNASYDPDTDRIIKKTRHGAVKKRPAKIAAAGRKIHRSHSALAKKSHRKTVLAKKSHRKTVRTAHSKKGKTPEVARQGDDGPQG